MIGISLVVREMAFDVDLSSGVILSYADMGKLTLALKLYSKVLVCFEVVQE